MQNHPDIPSPPFLAQHHPASRNRPPPKANRVDPLRPRADVAKKWGAQHGRQLVPLGGFCWGEDQKKHTYFWSCPYFETNPNTSFPAFLPSLVLKGKTIGHLKNKEWKPRRAPCPFQLSGTSQRQHSALGPLDSFGFRSAHFANSLRPAPLHRRKGPCIAPKRKLQLNLLGQVADRSFLRSKDSSGPERGTQSPTGAFNETTWQCDSTLCPSLVSRLAGVFSGDDVHFNMLCPSADMGLSFSGFPKKGLVGKETKTKPAIARVPLFETSLKRSQAVPPDRFQPSRVKTTQAPVQLRTGVPQLRAPTKEPALG